MSASHEIKVVDREARDRLGEGPVWMPRRGELLWVDITGQAVSGLNLDTGKTWRLAVDEPIGWVVPRARHPDVVAGFRRGFATLDLATGRRRMIGEPEPDRPTNRLNDAKVDPHGRIWAGSKDDRDEQASGALYRLDVDWQWQRLDDDYGVANGPAFSPDGRLLYHTDSAARTIFVFDLAEDGAISGKRAWLRFDPAWGYPDGMTTDAEGCLWVAHWGGGRVSRFAPDGKLIAAVPLPATNITSCAFAGPTLDRLFVTSSTIDHEREPLAGALFEIDAGVAGVASNAFAG